MENMVHLQREVEVLNMTDLFCLNDWQRTVFFPETVEENLGFGYSNKERILIMWPHHCQHILFLYFTWLIFPPLGFLAVGKGVTAQGLL